MNNAHLVPKTAAEQKYADIMRDLAKEFNRRTDDYNEAKQAFDRAQKVFDDSLEAYVENMEIAYDEMLEGEE